MLRDPSGQGHALLPALTTFQIPRRPEKLLQRDTAYLHALFDRISGPDWRRTADYDDEVERYAESLRVNKAAYCAMEYFRWAFRSVPRPDGHRAAQRLRAGVTVPVLQLHGEVDRWMLARTAQGSGRYVHAQYDWRLLGGVGHFPQDEAPERITHELIDWLARAT